MISDFTNTMVGQHFIIKIKLKMLIINNFYIFNFLALEPVYICDLNVEYSKYKVCPESNANNLVNMYYKIRSVFKCFERL